ncbi:Polyadenylate-binding protein 1 [Nymphon striatum]|nr:Polyadenylate-binding protein 1 [Nymphon striatum]
MSSWRKMCNLASDIVRLRTLIIRLGQCVQMCIAQYENSSSKGYGFVNFETEEAASNAIIKVNGTLINGKKVYVGKFIPSNNRDIDIGDKNKRFTNIFIKNLGKSIDNEALYDNFSSFGNILSCKVSNNSTAKCVNIVQDENSNSKGYGYINFESEEAANNAIENVNGTLINGKKVYVGSFIPSNERETNSVAKDKRFTNIFIKNLEKSIDNEVLNDKFSSFGNILSSKIVQDENSNSKGYGYINFESEEAANNAIENINGTLINGKKVYVGSFIPSNERETNSVDKNKRFTNIFIKNLEKSIDNEVLNDKFSSFGNILSSKIVQDENSNSKGYGYINFESEEAANNAIENVNGTLINGKKVYVGSFIPSNERETNSVDKNKRFTNIFIKNLEKSIDNEVLNDKFSSFGNILSSKIVQDENSNSKGYGYINFESEEAANNAIENINGTLINGKKVYVGSFIPSNERETNSVDKNKRFTNIFIKNLEKSIDNEVLNDKFSSFGNILSSKIVQDENSNSKGYGYINFESEEAANNAIENVNGTLINGKKVYVGSFIPSNERETNSVDKNKRFTNIFIKNLEKSIDNEVLNDKFSSFGNILSSKIVQDENSNSKGYGYINFESEEAANNAIENINGTLINGKKVYVGSFIPSNERETNSVDKNKRFTNIFIKNLEKSIDNEVLNDKFSSFGNILSSKIVQDENSNSKGYGYINFESEEAANNAIENINGTLINGKKVYVGSFIPSNERETNSVDKNKRFTNIFIKNLEKSIDNEALYDNFSSFGNIISCKIWQGENSNSKGYVYVNFETEKTADNAILKVNGKLISGAKVCVGRFISSNERKIDIGDKNKSFTNVFIKGFGRDKTEEDLIQLFEPFGKITSHKIMFDKTGKSRGFGYCSFENPEDAEKAVQEMNGKELNNRTLFAERAQKHEGRQTELQSQFEQIKTKIINRNQDVNLFVKNPDDSTNNERLRKEFSSFGTITSAMVNMKEDRYKKSGFECFSSPEDAAKAIIKISGRLVDSKPMCVALNQRKEDRKANLASHYKKSVSRKRMQQVGQIYKGDNSFFVAPNMPQAQHGSYLTGVSQTRSNPTGAPPTPQQQLRSPAQAGATYPTPSKHYNGGAPRPHTQAQARSIQKGAGGIRGPMKLGPIIDQQTSGITRNASAGVTLHPIGHVTSPPSSSVRKLGKFNNNTNRNPLSHQPVSNGVPKFLVHPAGNVKMPRSRSVKKASKFKDNAYRNPLSHQKVSNVGTKVPFHPTRNVLELN